MLCRKFIHNYDCYLFCKNLSEKQIPQIHCKWSHTKSFYTATLIYNDTKIRLDYFISTGRWSLDSARSIIHDMKLFGFGSYYDYPLAVKFLVQKYNLIPDELTPDDLAPSERDKTKKFLIDTWVNPKK